MTETSSEVWDAATAERYDEDSVEMFAPEVLGPTVEFLTGLADRGPVVEFAIGTGRVALPLHERGLEVRGIELSAPMVERLRAKPGGREIEVTIGDMATAGVGEPGSAALVVLAWNSLSNLCTQDEQVACFANAAAHLRPGGRFVVELWIPEIDRLAAGGRVALGTAALGEHIVLDEFDVATQSCVSHHYWHDAGPDDGQVRYGTGRFRYAWPAELDLMARLAGLAFEARYGGWDRAPFDHTSTNAVSVWRRPEG